MSRTETIKKCPDGFRDELNICYINIYIYIYVCILCVYIYIYIHIYIYIYTHRSIQLDIHGGRSQSGAPTEARVARGRSLTR